MKKIAVILLLVSISSFSAFADNGTFGNPYPARSTSSSYGGHIFMLPPPSAEQPAVRNIIDYSYYNARPVSNPGGFVSRSTRNVLNGTPGPGRSVPISGDVSRRGIVNGTSIFLRHLSSMRKYR